MSNKNSLMRTMPNSLAPESSVARELMTGVVIGGAVGVAVGALATLLARIFLGAAGQLFRKVLGLEKADRKFDPRWLLQ